MIRRTFFQAGPALAAALWPVSAAANAEYKPPRRGKLLRIGVLTCHPRYHHMTNIYGPLINCTVMPNGYIPTRMTGMELTHVWDRDRSMVDRFCASFKTEPVERYDGMIGRVDGIMLTDMRNSNYFPQLAEPYLKAGIPVFFNRPFVSSMRRAKAIVDMSKRYGTPIITPSAWEFCKEVYTIQEKIREWGPEIRGVTAFNGSSEIAHDVHGVWMILAAVGGGVESVSVARRGESLFGDPSKLPEYKDGADSWTIRFKSRGESPGFFANLLNSLDHDSNAWIKVILEKGTFEQNLMSLLGGNMGPRFQFYFIPPLLEFQCLIEGRGMTQSHDLILEKTAAFLAGFKSMNKLDGRPAQLADLEDDFTVQSDPDPITYPDGMFR
jgi:predicted dehydrogenase